MSDLSVIERTAACILLDIEGTTSSISFVHDVMFKYVRDHLHDYLVKYGSEESIQSAFDQMAIDAGLARNVWKDTSGKDDLISIESHVLELMDQDKKATGLKALQGILWKDGFHSGLMVSHLFEDVHPALQRWQSLGIDLRIYSSGSIAAQKLFFGHTQEGNLLPFFSAHYDTNIGGKKEVASYRRIASDIGCSPSQVLFVSDLEQELDAAWEAGMQVVASCRAGNQPLSDGCTHPRVNSFANLIVRKP